MINISSVISGEKLYLNHLRPFLKACPFVFLKLKFKILTKD